MTIKRGVSLYSYQHEYAHGAFTVEDCVAQAAKAGALGIETLAEQMFPGFPFPGQPDLPDSFYGWWKDLMDRYGTTPTVHDMFLDTKRYTGRLLNHDEMVESLRRDVRHTARLGASGIRLIANTPPEVVEECAPYAHDHGVWMGIEIHSPHRFDDEWMQRHLDVASRVGTDVVGCVPDMGIFVHRLPRVLVDRALRDGADPSLVEEVRSTYDAHGDSQGLYERLRETCPDRAAVGLAFNASFMIAQPVSVLADHAELIKHVHAKLYEMVAPVDGGLSDEYSIPYREIVGVLKDVGYDGYLSTEYEGNRHVEDVTEVDSVDQVTRHQELLRSLIEED